MSGVPRLLLALAAAVALLIVAVWVTTPRRPATTPPTGPSGTLTSPEPRGPTTPAATLEDDTSTSTTLAAALPTRPDPTVGSLPSTTVPAAPCEYPGAEGAPVVQPDVVPPGGTVTVRGPAFAGEPEVSLHVDGQQVARGRARPTPDCMYDLSFAAPATPGRHELLILLDPPFRIEPPFDILVAS